MADSPFFVFSVRVSCFPASEYGDDFSVVARDEDGALRAVAQKYAALAKSYGDDEGDRCGRDDFDTLYSWWKEPYRSRAGYETGVSIERVVALDSIADSLVVMASLT